MSKVEKGGRKRTPAGSKKKAKGRERAALTARQRDYDALPSKLQGTAYHRPGSTQSGRAR